MRELILSDKPLASLGVQPGCRYCFGKLDDADSEINRRHFVQCSHCQSAYHSDCWQQNGRCAKCSAEQATPCLELRQLPVPQVAYPVQTATVKPSAVYYDLWWGTYQMPRFLLDKVAPWYADWQPRTAAKLQRWHANIKAMIYEQLDQASLRLLDNDPDSAVGQFIELHLRTLATLLAYLSYAIAYLFLRWLWLRIF